MILICSLLRWLFPIFGSVGCWCEPVPVCLRIISRWYAKQMATQSLEIQSLKIAQTNFPQAKLILGNYKYACQIRAPTDPKYNV